MRAAPVPRPSGRSDAPGTGFDGVLRQRALAAMAGMGSGRTSGFVPGERAANGELEREIAGLITEALNLDVQPQDIESDAPLYRDGLGLDSIDILEIALVVSKRYGIEIKAESEENHQIFRSLRRLAEFVAAQRTR